ncbi:hypothetical protein GLYMA_11G003100v4 [Glycine max]|uniref:uncharacterized protein isoform X3 n=1 Tax=Glycine max TaxID=3847 RepID=UPI001B357FFF|nr:uncharacterized protein LOC100799187 isoform X3 [Glycine max]KAG4386207.1 hypothetical protein GLYMA_11G003100v4 [Glycine max]
MYDKETKTKRKYSTETSYNKSLCYLYPFILSIPPQRNNNSLSIFSIGKTLRRLRKIKGSILHSRPREKKTTYIYPVLCPIRYASLNIYIFLLLFKMAEIPKLDLSSSCFDHREALDSEQKSQKILVSDHINAFQYTADSFVIDMDAFSSGHNKDATNANSRITRSLSRKGSQRLGDRKVNNNATLYDKDIAPAICSPKGALVGPFTPEKPAGMEVGTMDHSMNPHVHHPITTTANNIPTESKCSITRRNSFRRPSSWAIDPKRVLLFFATLSSMGTMLLIYFTLTISKQSADEYGGDWKH